ncbi:hypothetical protein V494_00699 [Pseudogymnoascus sp. VKM F-4513 (FW-928)]|nr:hypothetical protein V494_00699 [Pseudogymnoascus sp. VKM F-4513 (FW-928)]
MQLVNFLPLLLVPAVAAKATVYLIRHGEKPDDGGNGLSAAGLQRAQCLRSVFGSSSSYNIGYIMAQTPDSGRLPALFKEITIGAPAVLMELSDGSRARPLQTVQPLATDLGLSVDTSCDRDDQKCVADAVDNYSGSGNVLIAWEHDALTDIVDELGNKDAPKYPDDSFNLIWTDPSPYSDITATTSENCPGLD